MTSTRATLDALQVVDTVIENHRTVVSTHYESCWQRHAACLAVLIRDILEKS